MVSKDLPSPSTPIIPIDNTNIKEKKSVGLLEKMGHFFHSGRNVKVIKDNSTNREFTNALPSIQKNAQEKNAALDQAGAKMTRPPPSKDRLPLLDKTSATPSPASITSSEFKNTPQKPPFQNWQDKQEEFKKRIAEFNSNLILEEVGEKPKSPYAPVHPSPQQIEIQRKEAARIFKEKLIKQNKIY